MGSEMCIRDRTVCLRFEFCRPCVFKLIKVKTETKKEKNNRLLNVQAYDSLLLSACFLTWRAAFRFGLGLVRCFLGIVTVSESESVW